MDAYNAQLYSFNKLVLIDVSIHCFECERIVAISVVRFTI